MEDKLIGMYINLKGGRIGRISHFGHEEDGSIYCSVIICKTTPRGELEGTNQVVNINVE